MIGVIIRNRKKITSLSKYLKEVHIVDSVEEGYKLILNKYSKPENKSFILTSDDTITSFLDERYDEIADCFIFYNAGEARNELCLDGMTINGGRDVFISMASTYTYLLPELYSFRFRIRNYFRNSAWSYASTRLGMNLVTGWAFGMLNHEFPQNMYKKIPAGYIAMVELPDFRNRVLMGRIGIVRWFRELESTDCLFYYNKKDIKPFYSAILTSLLRKGVQQ